MPTCVAPVLEFGAPTPPGMAEILDPPSHHPLSPDWVDPTEKVWELIDPRETKWPKILTKHVEEKSSANHNMLEIYIYNRFHFNSTSFVQAARISSLTVYIVNLDEQQDIK